MFQLGCGFEVVLTVAGFRTFRERDSGVTSDNRRCLCVIGVSAPQGTHRGNTQLGENHLGAAV